MAKSPSTTDSNEQKSARVPALSLLSVSKSFRGREILSDISLNINENEFIVLLGASGSGKSTLLKLIAGLELPDQGELKIRGKDARHLQPNHRDCAFSFQSNACYDHWTVQQNLYRSAAPELLPTLAELIDAMELQPILESRPPKLSGGELARVSLLRTLVSDKHFLLLDEPLAQLNPRFRSIAKETLLHVHRDRNHTTLYVTHDLTEAMMLADRIVFLKDGSVAGLAPPRDMFELLLASNEEYASVGVPRTHMAFRNGKAVLPRQWKICSLRSGVSEEIVFDDTTSQDRNKEHFEYRVLHCRWGAGYWELVLSRRSPNQIPPDGLIEQYGELDAIPDRLIVHATETPWLPPKLATQLRELEQGIQTETTLRISLE